MLASAFLRLGLRRATPALKSGGLTRCVPLAHQQFIGFATATSTAKTPRSTTTKTKKATTTKAAKKPAVKKAAKKPIKKVKKVVKPKDKPWEARGADGKLSELQCGAKRSSLQSDDYVRLV